MSRVSKILAFVLLAVVGCILFFLLAPENFVPAAGPARPPGIPDGAQLATVNHIHDGDTLFLTTPDDDNLKVRLLGIGTPELDECGGPEGTAALSALAPEGSTVYTLADEEPLDQYGRSLLMLWTPDGQLINLSLVVHGHAESVFIGANRLYEEDFEAAEEDAQASSSGIWGGC